MGNSGKKMAEPGAPNVQKEGHSSEGVTGDATPKAPEQPVKYDDTNYKLQSWTDVQFDSYKKKKTVDFYGLVTVEAPAYEKENRPGIDCVCVLDVSGSMRGQKISLVRKSMRRLVRNLGSKDRVCFVTFDTNVRVLMDWTQMDENGKERARNNVKNLREGSSTNLAGGLVTGIEKLRDNFQNEVTSVLLFTDGEANVGEQSIPGILKLAKDAAGTSMSTTPSKWSALEVQSWLQNVGLGNYKPIFKENAVDGMMLLNDINADILKQDLGVKALHLKKFEREILSLKNKEEGEGEEGKTGAPQCHLVVNTFGFGAQHNNELLEKIASSFDGMYFYMKDEAAIIAGFANCLGGMLSTVAQEIKLNIRGCKGVKDLKVHKDDNMAKNKDGSVTVQFGDLQSEEKRHILISATIPKISKTDPCFKFFECEISYKNLVQNTQDKETLTATINRSGKIGKANLEVDISKNRVVAADAMLNAENLGENHKLAEARKVVNEAKKIIEKSISAKEEFCTNLIKDLEKCLEGLKDERQYDLFGKGYMMQNQKCLHLERAANYDMDYGTQMCYNNISKATAYEAFQRSDSMDSCDGDLFDVRRSPSPILQMRNVGDDLFVPNVIQQQNQIPQMQMNAMPNMFHSAAQMQMQMNAIPNRVLQMNQDPDIDLLDNIGDDMLQRSLSLSYSK